MISKDHFFKLVSGLNSFMSVTGTAGYFSLSRNKNILSFKRDNTAKWLKCLAQVFPQLA